MPMSERDKTIVRDLASKIAEIAALPVHAEKAEMWRRLNSLDPVRPMVMLWNDTWHETGHVIQLQCEDDFARGQEWWLRARLFHWETCRDDAIFEAVVHSPIHIGVTDVGIHTNATQPDHVFGAKRYNTIIEDGADPSMIQMPTVTVDWEATDRTCRQLAELYDGIFEVRKVGVAGHWFAVMDTWIEWRGIEKAFVDMVDHPEWVHAWMERLTEWHLMRLDQLEQLGALSLNNRNNTVGPGGLGYTDELPGPGFDGSHVRACDQWGHATTQIFSEVSPAMHEEFALRYERRFLQRFGLAGYGCCEPLDKKIDLVRTIPNLRRVSMSPWVDPARGAEGLKKDYVFSYKPNPAILGMVQWDGDLARRELRDALEKSRGCAVEVIMKDLHTVRGEVWRMKAWVDMAMELAEEFAA